MSEYEVWHDEDGFIGYVARLYGEKVWKVNTAPTGVYEQRPSDYEGDYKTRQDADYAAYEVWKEKRS